MSAEARIEKSKFELGAPDAVEPAVDEGDLTWGYAEDRITALVRDPDSAYLYWEITDEGIAGARARLGPAGPHGWCNLRIYDVSGREFDGTNANDYFDVRVDRSDREHYVMVRRPGSSMCAEIGVKTHEGYFQPIARSGRADFPRNAPSPNTSLEWMTVTGGDPPPCVAPYRSRYRGQEPTLPGREGAGYFDVWRAAFAPTLPEPPAAERHEAAGGSAPGHPRAAVRPAHVERWWRLDEWRSERPAGLRFSPWVGSREEAAWRAGPFPVEPHDPERIALALLGEAPLFWSEGDAGFVAYGPWQVVVQTHDAEQGRRVLATWSVRWVQATTPLVERWMGPVERRVVSGFEMEHGALGASEAYVAGMRGASELWRLGASERRAIGASEWALGGASEVGWLGASRGAFVGASALVWGGASAVGWGGGSELGASERLGASDKHPVGHVERWADRPLEPAASSRKEGP